MRPVRGRLTTDRPRLRLQSGFQVERVSGLTVAVASDAVEGPGQLYQLCLAIRRTVVAPGCDDECGMAAGLADDVIVARSVGVGRQQQLAGLGTAEGPGVEHDESVEAPAAGKVRAAADCGIIERGIGRGRIQSDEDNMVAGAPRAGEAISISSACGQQGSAEHIAAAECLPTAAGSGFGPFDHW